MSEGVADEDGGESDDAATEDHVASVRAWLEREGVVRNGGLLDVTIALLQTILEDQDGDGFAWLLQALPSARQRARLGRSILRLHRVLQQRAPLGATPHVMRDGVWAARSGVPLMVSLAELQMQAQVPTLEQAELPAESIVALRDVSDRLCALHHSVRWGRGRGEEGREGAARGESARLLARISWARARCEELLGSSEGSIGHLAECRALLKAAPPPAPLRAVPLLQGPAASHTIDIPRVEETEGRQTQGRLLQAAQGLLRRMYVAGLPCARAEWRTAWARRTAWRARAWASWLRAGRGSSSRWPAG